MRDTLFNLIVTMLGTCSKLVGENGTMRVYDYPITAPPGYPYAVVGSESLESTVLDNYRDTRRYNFKVQVVGEKFGDVGGMSQADALEAMRKTEDQIMGVFDAKNALGRPDIVIRTMPSSSSYGLGDNGARVVLTIGFQVDVAVMIALGAQN